MKGVNVFSMNCSKISGNMFYMFVLDKKMAIDTNLKSKVLAKKEAGKVCFTSLTFTTRRKKHKKSSKIVLDFPVGQKEPICYVIEALI